MLNGAKHLVPLWDETLCVAQSDLSSTQAERTEWPLRYMPLHSREVKLCYDSQSLYQARNGSSQRREKLYYAGRAPTGCIAEPDCNEATPVL